MDYPVGTTFKWVATQGTEEYREAVVVEDGVVQTKVYGLNETHGSQADTKFKDFMSWLKSLPPGNLTITQEAVVDMSNPL